MKRIAVTGAGGFIGRPLVLRLVEAGFEVIGVDRVLGTNISKEAQWVQVIFAIPVQRCRRSRV